MTPKEFIQQLDEARVSAAIAKAERLSSGEIRVYVTHHRIDDALGRARRRFLKLGMDRTRHRNAVLLYFAPRSHQFAIVGDTGIHEKCGDDFWRAAADAMSAQLKAGRFTEAVETAVQQIGEVLARHFPRGPDDRNELPDSVVRD